MKMMIVDDSQVIRRKIQRAIQQNGFSDIIDAANGMEAIAAYQQYQPEVVTMDLTMPEMDGVECVKEIIKQNPQVRILVVSALADKATAIEALKQGAMGFLCKPFTDKELTDALTELLNDNAEQQA